MFLSLTLSDNVIDVFLLQSYQGLIHFFHIFKVGYRLGYRVLNYHYGFIVIRPREASFIL